MPYALPVLLFLAVCFGSAEGLGQSDVSTTQQADPDLAYMARQLDWLPAEIDTAFFDNLRQRSAALRDDQSQRRAYRGKAGFH